MQLMRDQKTDREERLIGVGFSTKYSFVSANVWGGLCVVTGGGVHAKA